MILLPLDPLACFGTSCIRPAIEPLQSDKYDLLRFGIGRWCQQHSLNEAEYRGTGPDTEREGEHGHGGEAGVFHKLADGEAEIIHDAAPPSDRPSLRGGRATSRPGSLRWRALVQRR